VSGTFIYEPAGEAHTLVVTDDSPEPAQVVFMVEAGERFGAAGAGRHCAPASPVWPRCPAPQPHR
jgi:hypothetical protein